jgi:hypothetical protein
MERPSIDWVVDGDRLVSFRDLEDPLFEDACDQGCRRVVFETGRMAPILFHCLADHGVPVVCVESRQAYQALKSLTTHIHRDAEPSGTAC